MFAVFAQLIPVVQVMVVCCIILILVNQNACNRFIRSVNAIKQLLTTLCERPRRRLSSKRKLIRRK